MKVQVWYERRCESPQWYDWLIGVASFEPAVIDAFQRACPDYGGPNLLREYLGRPNIGMVARVYGHVKDPMPHVVATLTAAGFDVEEILRPPSLTPYDQAVGRMLRNP